MVTKKERILELRDNDSTLKLQDIANDVGLSRERVRQILKESNRQTSGFVEPKVCARVGCNITYPRSSHSIYCSTKCSNLVYYTLVNCNWCGKQKLITKSDYKRNTEKAYRLFGDSPKYKGNFYCDRKCFGEFIGNTYGWFSLEHKHKRLAKIMGMTLEEASTIDIPDDFTRIGVSTRLFCKNKHFVGGKNLRINTRTKYRECKLCSKIARKVDK